MESRMHDPRYWFKQAKELDQAAWVIWDAIRVDLTRLSRMEAGSIVPVESAVNANLGGIFWLLAGFALENALKGLIIRNEPDAAIDGRLDRSLRTHNLLRLAKRASVPLTVAEAFYLQVGTQCTTWAGRYPASMRRGDTGLLVFSEADTVAYRAVYGELAARFEQDMPSTTLVRLV